MMRIIVSLSLQERPDQSGFYKKCFLLKKNLKKTRGIDKSILYLNWSRVIYVESLGNHTVIHTLDQEFESTESLKTLEKRYGNLFLKCHESYMVNPAHVHSIRRFKMTVTGGRELPVPEKKYTAVKKTLQKIIAAR